MYKNKLLKNLISSTLLGVIISLSIGLLFSFLFSNICEYHEPINKVPGTLFNLCFNLVSSHPKPNGYYWFLVLLCGITLGFFYKKKA